MLECHPWGEVMKKGIIITLLGGTFWGISGTMGQFLFQTYHLNTMWLTTLRMIFAGIILLSVCFIKDTVNLIIWKNLIVDHAVVVFVKTIIGYEF